MKYGEFDGAAQSREAENAALVEAARDSVHRLCEQMIHSSFNQLRDRLAQDAAELEMYAVSGSPQGKSVDIYVSPDRLHAPAPDGDAPETLTLLLEHGPLVDDDEFEHFGDRLRIYLPVASDYVYPEPLEGADAPEEMYVEFMPGSASTEPHARYVILHDMNDPQFRFNLYAYESATDGNEEIIHDDFSDKVMQDALFSRIPENVEVAGKLLRRLGNFDAVYQKSVSPH